jgi:hypothetical protein
MDFTRSLWPSLPTKAYSLSAIPMWPATGLSTPICITHADVGQGGTLYEVQHILGHTQVKTTQRYAHLSQDTLLAAANAATLAVGAVMMPTVSVAVAPALMAG